MTTPRTTELELRLPAFALATYAVSLVVAAGMVVLYVREDFDRGLFGVVFPLFLIGILAVNTATALSRVRAFADGTLEVRNRFTTRTVHRSDVERVLVDRQPGFGSPRRLELLLTDGQGLHLIATEVPPLPGLRRRLERQAEQLRAWVAGTPTPYL